MDISSSTLHKRNWTKGKNFVFNFINKLKLIEQIEVYDNDKNLILVGMDKENIFYHIIKFNRYSIELDYEIMDKIYNTDEVTQYLKKALGTK